ncbi:hypothetical protein PHJA_000761800 [Phtheirospermum japonicum]|uniref:Uncharacterized protein n=1 Tax=Phtheirospermum japonicum TaxID=374723 RepID=A0A830BEZ9_9LAMI|nr:hypothetical protein PHJA_000761800 [Phtheirospermum japonicum]
MAETQTPQKRLRDEKAQEGSAGSGFDGSKRQKPYNNIISLLDDDDEEEVEPSHEPSHELSHDLSAIFTTLQQELTSFGSPPSSAAAADDMAGRHVTGGGDGEEGLKLAVMRHLLEASDDELGIPNRSTDEINPDILDSGENFNVAFNDDGLWEFEDETANYYTGLQSELFM